jgi:hypothetical protein
MAPVIHRDSLLARNTAAPVMSSGMPIPCSGWRCRISSASWTWVVLTKIAVAVSINEEAIRNNRVHESFETVITYIQGR